MSVDYSVIGRRIKQRRRDMGATQDRLAEALGVSVGYISQIERGVTRVNLDTLSRIAVFLRCDVGELVSGSTVENGQYLSGELTQVYGAMDDRQRRLLLQIAEILTER